MGSCLGSRSRERNQSSRSTRERQNYGKNIPLRHERIRWKSDQPLTEGQVRSKRDEFWDTAPAFEGRKEIWDGLKAAVVAIEDKNYDMAQAIIDGCSVTLPNGTLTDCYDELGNRYQLPVYCFSMPLNLILQSSEKLSEFNKDNLENDKGDEIELKVRLSTTLVDASLLVYSHDLISQAKRKLDIERHLGGLRQRWYYNGKMLGDKLAIHECNIITGWIIQCILSDDTTSEGT